MKIKFLIFTLLILLQSCTNAASTGFRFNEEKSLTGKTLPVADSVYFRYPFRIRQTDSLLYILDLHGPDFYCHILRYPEMTLATSLAHKGNGPGEFLRVENIRLDRHGAVYLLDANTNAISIYNSIHDSLSKRVNLSEKLIRCLDFTLVGNSLFAVPDYSGTHRINIVDGNGNIQKQLFKIPTRKKNGADTPDIALAQAWRSFVDYNPDNGILAMATQLGQVIEVYNLQTDEIIHIAYGQSGEPEFVTQDTHAIPNGIMGYSDLHVDKDRIYTLFWGTSFEDIRKNPLHRMEGGNIIQVFSLEGEPLIQYTLDRHITGFSIDNEKNKLLGLDVNNEQQIVEYKL